MTTIRNFNKGHPLATYVALTFAISWGGILLVVGPGRGGFQGLLTLGYVAILAGPSLAGILLTGLLDGRAGLRDLLSRLLRWRVGLHWYAVALLTAPLTIVVVLLVLSLASPEFLPRLFVHPYFGMDGGDRLGLLQFSVVVGLLVGIFEELGWTGFAVPTLLRRHGVLGTGLIVGLLFAAWNFLVVYLKEAMQPAPGTLPLAIYLAAVLLTWQPAYRLLLVWVYDRTRSLPVVMLMAASLVTFWTSLTPMDLSRTTLAVFYLALAAVWCAVAAVVALTNHGHLTRQSSLRERVA